jgi:hypothetical protein
MAQRRAECVCPWQPRHEHYDFRAGINGSAFLDCSEARIREGGSKLGPTVEPGVKRFWMRHEQFCSEICSGVCYFSVETKGRAELHQVHKGQG